MSNQSINYNLDAIKLTTNASTSATTYFNNYFLPTFTVAPNVDAAVISYFESVTENKESAKVLASAVIYTAHTQGIDPMSILGQFTNLPTGELTQYLTMFLNMQRVGTSFLGLSTQPLANKYVSRAVLP